MRRELRQFLVVMSVAVVAGCGGGQEPTKPGPPPPPPPPPAPIPGDLIISMNGLSAATGAILLTVGGDAISGVAPVTAANRLVSSPSGTNSLRIILTGTLANGDLIKVSVPDVAKVASYTVAVESVADKTTFALGDITKYPAAIRR